MLGNLLAICRIIAGLFTRSDFANTQSVIDWLLCYKRILFDSISDELLGIAIIA